MKSYTSPALAVAFLFHPAVSDPVSATKPSPSSLRGATAGSRSSAGEVSKGSGRQLQYADQSCYEKQYSDEGTQVVEVACSTIMGSCSKIETTCAQTFQEVYDGASLSSINSWYIYFDPNGQADCQWDYTVCS